ncbi:MAG: hypothetical protein HY238_08990 [Acidobacteria bacterium]|nr:hypothetical protein [Acidobacteriota bacterium]
MRYTPLSLLVLAAGCGALTVAADGQPPRNRLVRVVAISQDRLPRDPNQALFEATMERLNQAASFRPDVACLPELFSAKLPESVPGPTTDRLAAWARKHSAYVIAGLKTQADGCVYNSAVLLDRQGRIAGRFDKIHPTEKELQEGITPGSADPPVFQTDFGLIGIQICFDVNWWDTWKRLKEKGVKMLFFPSAFPAARQLSALALMSQYYVVSSPMRGQSRVYDVSGEVLASSGNYQPWAGFALPIGKRLFEIDYHVDKVRRIQQKYGRKVEVVWFHDDDWFTLASLDPDLTVEDIMQEFGLTPLDGYRLRATKAIDDARAGHGSTALRK